LENITFDVSMKYRIEKSKFGYFGVVFQPNLNKAIRVILPCKKAEQITEIRTQFPASSENMNGMPELVEQIVRYFDGENILIPMKYVDTSICSPFQLKVLEAERTIPFGKTASYSWLANSAGTTGVRAAGSALARNPFPIVVPCHRAVRSTRKIGMYQGGPTMKRQLLKMEGVEFDRYNRVLPQYFLG